MNSGINAAGTYGVTSLSHQTIDALVLAISVAIAGSGGVGIAASGSGVSATNEIAVDALAYQDGDGSGVGSGVHATSITVSAADTSAITADAAAASLAASVAGALGLSISIGVSLAMNQVANDVEAYIANANDGVSTTVGDVAISAKEDATIHATSTAASLAASFGAVGVGISGAGGQATNVIVGKDNAYASGSNLVSARAISLTTEDLSNIQATITTASVGVGVGTNGVGASIGASVAKNFIGYNADGTKNDLQVKAYALNSSTRRPRPTC